MLIELRAAAVLSFPQLVVQTSALIVFKELAVLALPHC
jgi:hypothetical protein